MPSHFCSISQSNSPAFSSGIKVAAAGASSNCQGCWWMLPVCGACLIPAVCCNCTACSPACCIRGLWGSQQTALQVRNDASRYGYQPHFTTVLRGLGKLLGVDAKGSMDIRWFKIICTLGLNARLQVTCKQILRL